MSDYWKGVYKKEADLFKEWEATLKRDLGESQYHSPQQLEAIYRSKEENEEAVKQLEAFLSNNSTTLSYEEKIVIDSMLAGCSQKECIENSGLSRFMIIKLLDKARVVSWWD